VSPLVSRINIDFALHYYYPLATACLLACSHSTSTVGPFGENSPAQNSPAPAELRVGSQRRAERVCSPTDAPQCSTTRRTTTNWLSIIFNSNSASYLSTDPSRERERSQQQVSGRPRGRPFARIKIKLLIRASISPARSERAKNGPPAGRRTERAVLRSKPKE